MSLLGYHDSIKSPAYFTPWAFIHGLAGLMFSLLSLTFLKKQSAIKNLCYGAIIHTIYEFYR